MSGRAAAIAVADGSCPRCGSARGPDDRYCLDCGLALPRVTGRLPGLRRAWLRSVGWYPGDWIWGALLALLVAVAGTAAAIVVSGRRAPKAIAVFTAPATVAVAAPTPVVSTTPRSRTTATSTLPVPPEPGTNGRLTWPKDENGWTVVLVSYPKVSGRAQALDTAAKAARGLRQVGILDSGGFASLQPGYLVVFAGVYPSKAAADAAVPTARQAGFGGAYSRQIAR
ncbi:MAG TPA: zinc ribbon domain-containing protein [Gaiellaceae bacterium]|nr:zinc ribbon domain-containing protein [Gaiellaceae bacterium]